MILREDVFEREGFGENEAISCWTKAGGRKYNQ